MILGVYLPFFIFFTTAVSITFCTVWAILTKVLHCIARFFFRLSLYHSPPQYSVTKHRQSLKVILHPTYIKELVLKMFLLNLTWSVSFLSSAYSLLRESSNWEPSWQLETRLIPPPPAKQNIGGGCCMSQKWMLLSWLLVCLTIDTISIFCMSVTVQLVMKCSPKTRSLLLHLSSWSLI